MSDSNKQLKKKQKQLDASLRSLSAKQRKDALQAQKDARRTRLYAILAGVVAVLVAALLFWDNGIVQRNATAMTVGSKNYSAADVDYYYYSQYNNAMTYASLYGIDTSVSLKEQEAYDGTSWYDYFMEAAKTSLTNVSMLSQEAEAAGYTISAEGQSNIDTAMENLDEACKQYGISTSSYLNQMFGRFMNKARYKKILTEYYYAYDYEDAKTAGFEISESDITDYYNENKNKLDTFDLNAYYLSAAAETRYDEDGEAVEATEEETAAAADAAKENAAALEAALKKGTEADVAALVEQFGATDRSTTAGSSVVNFTYGDWAVDAKRKAGDVTTIEDKSDETVNGYYVVRFNGRAREDYHPVNVRNILVRADEVDVPADSSEGTDTTELDYDTAKATIEELEQTWKDNGGTEEDFAALSREKSVDASSNYNGGLYENVVHNKFIDEIDEWLFDSSRKAGDTAVIMDENNEGYQLLYFVGTDDLAAWQQTAKDELQSTAYDKWFNETIENYEAKTGFMFRYVG